MRVVSWNVEHFKGSAARVRKVVGHLQSLNPDVFAILEVKKADVRDLMENSFPGFDFALTDGPQVQELLVGWRRHAADAVVFSQKREFKAYNPALRPGALLTLKLGPKYLNLLFLHTDSGTKASDFGNRFEMFERVFRLKKKLGEKAPDGEARLVAMGDLNTMGLLFPKRRKSDELVSATDEVSAIGELAHSAGMRFLDKEHDLTFNNGRLRSDLDHVILSDGLSVRRHTGDGIDYDVLVRGWNQLTGNARKSFIDKISDHSAIAIDVDV